MIVFLQINELSSYLNDTSGLVAMVCRETNWTSLQLDGETDRDQLRDFYCTLDIDGLMADLGQIIDPVSFMAEVRIYLCILLTTGRGFQDPGDQKRFLL